MSEERVIDAGDIAGRLLRAGEKLPDADREAILRLGAEAVPALIEALTKEDWQWEGGPGDGWAPIHAARLLGELCAEAAIPHLIDLLGALGVEAILYSEVQNAIRKIGEPALLPLLDAYARYEGEARSSVVCTLGELGVQHEAIFPILEAFFKEKTELGAVLFGQYGDPRALPLLRRALNVHHVPEGPCNPFEHHIVIELADAIERLGGNLTTAQHDKLNLVRTNHVYRPPEQPVRRVASAKIGRNDPCWCGSGKKYKHCHWKSDRG